MKQRHKHADVIIAWANGEEIELFYNGQWIDAKTPNFCAMYEYRIKPNIVKREAEVVIYKSDNGAYGACVSFGHIDAVYNATVVKRIKTEWEEEEPCTKQPL